MDIMTTLLKISTDLAVLKTAFQKHEEGHRIRYKIITFIWSGFSFLLGLWLEYFYNK